MMMNIQVVVFPVVTTCGDANHDLKSDLCFHVVSPDYPILKLKLPHRLAVTT